MFIYHKGEEDTFFNINYIKTISITGEDGNFNIYAKFDDDEFSFVHLGTYKTKDEALTFLKNLLVFNEA